MIIIDSSVWITYYRPGGTKELKEIVIRAISSDLAAVNGMIMTEVLSGISKEREYALVQSDFKGFHYLPLNKKDFFEASLLGASLRKTGLSIPSTDLLIARSAISSKSTLYHLDRHFDLIAKQMPSLKARNLRATS